MLTTILGGTEPSRQAHSKVHKGTARKAIPPFSSFRAKGVEKGSSKD
jgi:hypothetical protein